MNAPEDRLGFKIGHCGDVRCMTALPPKAEVHLRSCYVGEVPISAITSPSFEHLVRGKRPPFAERDLWNIGRGRSLRFDVGCPDHLCPFLGFLAEELAVFGRGEREGGVAEVDNPRPDPGI